MAAENEEEAMEQEVNGHNDEDNDKQPKEDDSDDSSDDEKPVDPKIKELQAQLAETPYEYDRHLELIELLRSAGELDQLRDAREAMNKCYPLAPKLWLEWINDEKRIIDEESEKDREKIIRLFERAVRDYRSVDVWLEYVMFMVGDKDTEKTREVFERAVKAVGYHVNKGALIWQAYREYEETILDALSPQIGSVAKSDQQEAIDKQIEKVTSIFARQLVIPLIDMEATLAEYRNFAPEVNEGVIRAYGNALKKVKDVEAFETQLLNEDGDLIEIYNKYLDAEEEVHTGRDRMISLFERAITEKCLDAGLWIRYTKYCDRVIGLDDSDHVCSVYERSVRNCPWFSELWVGYIRAFERHGKSSQRVRGLVDRAIGVGFHAAHDHLQIWTAWIDYLRRGIRWTDPADEEDKKHIQELRETFEAAIETIQNAFPRDLTIVVPLYEYRARLEAKFAKNMEKARECYTQITKLGKPGELAQTWLDYFILERAYGTHKHCRKILQRAINAVADWPEGIIDAYINYEREEGTLEQFDQAVARCEMEMQKIREWREQEEQIQKERYRERRSNYEDKDSKSSSRAPKGNKGKKDRSRDDRKDKKSESSPPSAPVFKRGQSSSQEEKSSPIKETGGGDFKVPALPEPSNRKKSAPPPGFKPKSAPPPGFKSDDKDEDGPPAKRAKVEETSQSESDDSGPDAYKGKEAKTAFVSNINYEVTDERLKEVFAPIGDIVEVRLIKNATGKSKGYAYVEFVDELAAQKALSLDRTSVDGRPMFVSRCEERKPGNTAKFRYATDLEKNKLFVRGLPFSATKEQLEQLFGEHGKVTDVRLVTYKNGKPKGLAYVEYETASDAAQSILKLDNTELDGHTISVAISCPPDRKPAQKTTADFTPSLGGGKKEGVDRGGRARTMISFQPRALQRPPQPKPASVKPSGSQPAAKSSSTDNGNAKSGMSNDDFRAMLLKK